jgi:hypothetical protein
MGLIFLKYFLSENLLYLKFGKKAFETLSFEGIRFKTLEKTL